jgi:hypothetical protein
MRTTSHWAVLFVLLLFSVRAQARTWRVFADGTGDTPTIQAARDAAIPEDSSAVAPGTYFENLTFRKPAITLHSTRGPEVTRLDGNHADRVIMVFEPNASIQGFTITRGRTRFEGTFFAPGGGVSILGDATLLRNNIIEQNESGVLFDHHSGGAGGGVYVSAFYCVIEGNTIRGNVAGSAGGGIAVSGLLEKTHTIANNMIIGNASGLAGGAVAGTSARFTGNVVAENVAGFFGSGLYVDYFECSNNTFVANRGGPTVRLGWYSSFQNNIVAGNTVRIHDGAIHCIAAEGISIRCNDIWGNTFNSIVCSSGSVEDNIWANPLFCPEGTGSIYHISSTSPCAARNAGSCGQIGALGVGCLITAVEHISWTTMKRLYRFRTWGHVMRASVPAGLYFARFEGDGKEITARLVILP